MGSKLREYQGLWLTISKADGPVTVTCHPSFTRRLIQAVRKEKTAVNTLRKRLDLPAYGNLDSKVEKTDNPRQVKVIFSLSYNGDKL